MSATGVESGIVQAWGHPHWPSTKYLNRNHEGVPIVVPGCYAYGDEHLGGNVTLRGLSDYKGDELVRRFLAIDRHQPLHDSIVGGEPLVRYKGSSAIPPQLAGARRAPQLDQCRASHFKRVAKLAPAAGGRVDRWSQPEHDVRRTPATYERILKHIEVIRSRSTAPSRDSRFGGTAISGSDAGRPIPTRA